MRLAQRLTFRFALGTSNVCLVGENPTCSLSRHCRDEKVNGHTTTAMHDIEYTPVPRAPLRERLALRSRSAVS